MLLLFGCYLDKAHLFIDKDKLSQHVHKHLDECNVQIENYDNAVQRLRNLCVSNVYFSQYTGHACKSDDMPAIKAMQAQMDHQKTVLTPTTPTSGRIWIDEKKINYSIYRYS